MYKVVPAKNFEITYGRALMDHNSGTGRYNSRQLWWGTQIPAFSDYWERRDRKILLVAAKLRERRLWKIARSSLEIRS